MVETLAPSLWNRASHRRERHPAIRRRYSSMLVPVRPVTTAPGSPVIDVATFAALVRLAERYGLLVLHWTRSGIETFIVQDEGNTYRYRTGAQDPQSEDPESLAHRDLQSEVM